MRTDGETSAAAGNDSAVTTPKATSTNPVSQLRGFLRRQGELYRNGADRPLAGYSVLLSVYSTGTLAAGLVARRLGRPQAERISPWDTLLLVATTHKVSRIIAKDPVTSPIRSPFTTYTGVSAPSELAEEVRGHGLQHSVGELITCPMCLAQWVATAGVFGLIFAPKPTRMALTTFTAVTGSDFLQQVYATLQQAAEG